MKEFFLNMLRRLRATVEQNDNYNVISVCELDGFFASTSLKHNWEMYYPEMSNSKISGFPIAHK